jgi:guanine deaminase
MPVQQQTILGPILIPRPGGRVDFVPDGALRCDASGVIDYIGPASALPPSPASSRKSRGIITPPFLDAHIHIPQHPIRGHFMDGVNANPPEGRLIAGLNRNVFPAEAKCADEGYTARILEGFADETLSQGVVGGAAYMTVHTAAAEMALKQLSPLWSLGPVLMEMNCPEYLRTDRSKFDDAFVKTLADRFGRRFIITDRFAVAVGSELRQWAARMSSDFGLRMQTHLNEQIREKEFVEKKLYTHYASYTDVYYRDGLLDHDAILAHCVHMTDAELNLVTRAEAVVAHCPTSNTLLCSGIMPLDRITAAGIEYAICTDVGASPTTSILAEIAQFLKIHAGRSDRATPAEALYRATIAPAKILGVSDRVGSLEAGKPLSFIEVACNGPYTSADDAILRGLLGLSRDDLQRGEVLTALDELQRGSLDVGPALNLLEQDIRAMAERMEKKVQAVTVAGREIWRRDSD